MQGHADNPATRRLRRGARLLAAALSVAASAGCASRPDADVLTPTPTTVAGARAMTAYVATNRTPLPGSLTQFASTRSKTLRYARYVVAVPPSHRAGEVTWPKAAPDPSTDFVTLAADPISRRRFERESAPAGKKRDEVTLFVHGFNYSHQEAVYRLAQMTVDAKATTPSFAFAWPSKADFLAYGADQKDAAASVDDLAGVIDGLSRRPNVQLTLIGHSMGGWLTMQALVRLRSQGKTAALGKLRDVILAAPNISIDDFFMQLSAIGRLPIPITMLVSADDKALELSRILASGQARVGSADIHDRRVQEAARRYNVRVVDISELASAEGFNHDRYAAMAALYPRFRAQLDRRSGPDAARAGVYSFNVRTARLTAIND